MNIHISKNPIQVSLLDNFEYFSSEFFCLCFKSVRVEYFCFSFSLSINNKSSHSCWTSKRLFEQQKMVGKLIRDTFRQILCKKETAYAGFLFFFDDFFFSLTEIITVTTVLFLIIVRRLCGCGLWMLTKRDVYLLKNEICKQAFLLNEDEHIIRRVTEWECLIYIWIATQPLTSFQQQ